MASASRSGQPQVLPHGFVVDEGDNVVGAISSGVAGEAVYELVNRDERIARAFSCSTGLVAALPAFTESSQPVTLVAG